MNVKNLLEQPAVLNYGRLMDKKKDGGPSINRFADGSLDHDDANKKLKELTQKLITEERSFQKEISFKTSRSSKRDVMLFVTICQRNSVDGKIVLA